MTRPPRSAPSNISHSLASVARNQKFSRTGRLNLQKVVLKLKRLHIAGSTPSVSQSTSESDVSYTGPVRRNEGAIRLPCTGGIDLCNEDDMEDLDLDESADEIIVDGNLHPAVSSIDSRKHSIIGCSAPSLSQSATTQNLGESWSARAHYCEHLFRVSAAIANSKAWHRLIVYLDQSFMDETIERQYQKEHWWLRKPLALLGAFFILLSWVLAVALVSKPWSTFDYYAYIGIVGFFSLMLPLAVIADVPRHSTGQWQLLLALTTLSRPVVFMVEANLCGFYKDHPDNYFGGAACGNKDFGTMLLYAAAYPTVGLFSLKQTRAWAALSGVAYVIVYGVAILPE
ncbi:HisKA [Geranomyces variabilis]|nr:HisKA [Geranomyces variabilis]